MLADNIMVKKGRPTLILQVKTKAKSHKSISEEETVHEQLL